MVEDDLYLLLTGIVRAHLEPERPGKQEYVREKVAQAERFLREQMGWKEIV